MHVDVHHVQHWKEDVFFKKWMTFIMYHFHEQLVECRGNLKVQYINYAMMLNSLAENVTFIHLLFNGIYQLPGIEISALPSLILVVI